MSEIKLPVRFEITGGASCEIIDAEDYCIARALGTLKDDVYSPPEYWGEQIAAALNAHEQLAEAKAKVESEVRAERARIAAELRKLFGHPTGRCADLRRLTATEVLAFIEELEAK